MIVFLHQISKEQWSEVVTIIEGSHEGDTLTPLHTWSVRVDCCNSNVELLYALLAFRLREANKRGDEIDMRSVLDGVARECGVSPNRLNIISSEVFS